MIVLWKRVKFDKKFSEKFMENGIPKRNNPYDWINPVHNRKEFAGRLQEVNVIMEELKKLNNDFPNPPIVTLVGNRRVGKTSLLLRIDENCNEQALISIIINVNDIIANNVWEFWKEIFYNLISKAITLGIKVEMSSEEPFGFRITEQNNNELSSNKLIVDNLKFIPVYQISLNSVSPPLLSYQILKNDLNEFIKVFENAGYKGIVLILDESHLLQNSTDLKQNLRNLIQHFNKMGLIFSGEPSLANMFTDETEPFYGQSIVVRVDNFINVDDIAECTLLPLNSVEVKLISPMTIDYLSKLSKGKPNQIRLICKSIYKRYMNGLQEDLNITIDVLDDVLEELSKAFSESNLK